MSKEGTAYISSITDDGIAVLTIDYAPVNALADGLTNGVKNIVKALEQHHNHSHNANANANANADGNANANANANANGNTSTVKIPRTKVTGIVLRGAGRAFCAGANISAFGAKKNTPPVKLGRPTSCPFGLGEFRMCKSMLQT